MFATRAPRRPNAIGLSIVRLIEVNDATLVVEDVDILNGTPLLDLKPYIPSFDSYRMPCQDGLNRVHGMLDPADRMTGSGDECLPGSMHEKAKNVCALVFSNRYTVRMYQICSRILSFFRKDYRQNLSVIAMQQDSERSGTRLTKATLILDRV